MLVAHFEMPQLLRALFSQEDIDILTAAWAIGSDDCHRSMIYRKALAPVYVPNGAVLIPVQFAIKGDEARMLPPKHAPAKQVDDPTVRECVQSIHEQHMQFRKLRKVVRWLNDHATAGAAKYYCPWLTAVLPADHEFQKCNGIVFRDVNVSTSEIMPVMRECGTILASALLVNQTPALETIRTKAYIAFPHEDIDGDESQDFWFL